MREFEFKDRKYIVEHQDTETLKELAKKFKCNWHEVYRCYDQVTKTQSYRNFVEKRRENISNGECFGKQVEYVEDEEGKYGKSHCDKFFGTPYNNGRRAFDNVDYFKHARFQ